MTPTQFRAALKLAKLSQMGAARLFKVNERTTRRWALGERTVPDEIVESLLGLIAGTLTRKDIEAQS